MMMMAVVVVVVAAAVVLGSPSLAISHSHSAKEEHVPRQGSGASLQPSW